MGNLLDKLDPHFYSYTIEEIRPTDDGWEIRFDGGWWNFIEKQYGCYEPQVGDRLDIWYRNGPFTTITGMRVNDYIYRYLTTEQSDLNHEIWCYNKDMQERRYYETNKESFWQRADALPTILQRRMYKFHYQNPLTFAWKYGFYELFCCEQAVIIAQHFGTTEELQEWKKQTDWNAIRERVPELDDGHSGNTFDCACALAAEMIRGQEASYAWGGLEVVVGSKAFRGLEEA